MIVEAPFLASLAKHLNIHFWATASGPASSDTDLKLWYNHQSVLGTTGTLWNAWDAGNEGMSMSVDRVDKGRRSLLELFATAKVKPAGSLFLG